MVFPDSNETYTFADYLVWEDDIFAEVINGKIISMSPSPTPKHQNVVDELTAEFKMFLRGKECMAFSAPMDVCLFANAETKAEDILDWVQPDLFVICDLDKIGEKNITGAPDLVIEVLSPSTARNDRLIKFQCYEKARVGEYWIVDPSNMSIEIYTIQNNVLKQVGVFGREESLSPEIFPDLQIDLRNIFKD